MTVEAKINKEWGIRLLLIGVLFLGGAGWFFYDGAIGYPRDNEIYRTVYEQLPDGRWANEPRDNWQTRVKEELGLDPVAIEPRKLDYHDGLDITAQFLFAGLCLPIGLLAMVWLLINKQRSIVADEAGVAFAGKKLDYGQITEIDYARWRSKGIVVLEAGEQRMTLDDWKFRGVQEVLDEVLAHRPDLPRPPVLPPQGPAADAQPTPDESKSEQNQS